MKIIEYLSAFAAGAFIYTVGEIMFRGYTHWTMTLTGGACLAVLYMWNELLPSDAHATRWLIGAASITLIEFAVGCVVNLGLGQHVWDYSGLRFNFLGQISLLFSLLWCLLSIPAYALCDMIKKMLQVLE